MIVPLLLSLVAVDSKPAFLDGLDSITVWTPAVSSAQALSGHVSVTLDGHPLAVKQILAQKPLNLAGPADPSEVVVAGTFQHIFGGTDWNPGGRETRMREIGPGLYQWAGALPAGHYEYKIAKGGTWDLNWGAGFVPGGPNVSVDLAKDTNEQIQVDFNQKQISATAVATLPPLIPAGSNESKSETTNVFSVQLARGLSAKQIAGDIEIKLGNDAGRRVFPRNALDSLAFAYGGEDLGSRWTPGGTTFKLWDPAVRRAAVELFRKADGPLEETLPMTESAAGIWSCKQSGDLNGWYYRFKLEDPAGTRFAPDVYCIAASLDGTRSQILDLKATNPSAWPGPGFDEASFRQTDAVLYELHIRDFTIDPASGVQEAWRGKYLGMTDPDRLDYLKRLGVNAVHLLPLQKYNPGNPQRYNWGYETNLFNVPENRYGTKPEDSAQNSLEFKEMVEALHQVGIRVVMDVVYNHSVPSEGPASAFWQTIPYYWFRTDASGHVINESGVGNSMDDDHPMVSKYIRDSLVFWANEYHIDGFRFDEAAIFNRSSVADWSATLHRLRPDIILYGEPWTGGGPIRFGKGRQKGLDFAVFNDDFRDTLRGQMDGPGPGYMFGNGPTEPIEGMLGSINDFTQEPDETVNYLSCHDNMTLWDKVALSMPGSSVSQKEEAMKFGYAVLLLSQGMPFLEGGAEMGRTKGGNPNSYNAGDAVNAYKWSELPTYEGLVDYTSQLIRLRLAHPAFRIRSAAMIRDHVHVVRDGMPDGTFGLLINGAGVGDSWKSIFVIVHGRWDPGTVVRLPPGSWRVKLDAGGPADVEASGQMQLQPLTVTVLAQ